MNASYRDVIALIINATEFLIWNKSFRITQFRIRRAHSKRDHKFSGLDSFESFENQKTKNLCTQERTTCIHRKRGEPLFFWQPITVSITRASTAIINNCGINLLYIASARLKPNNCELSIIRFSSTDSLRFHAIELPNSNLTSATCAALLNYVKSEYPVFTRLQEKRVRLSRSAFGFELRPIR